MTDSDSELFPGEGGQADQATMDSFFKEEKIPAKWSSRVVQYNTGDVGTEIGAQYNLYPVAFGGNQVSTPSLGTSPLIADNDSQGAPNTFAGFGENKPYFQEGLLTSSGSTPQGIACLLYQMATGGMSIPVPRHSGVLLTRPLRHRHASCHRPPDHHADRCIGAQSGPVIRSVEADAHLCEWRLLRIVPVSS